MTSNADRQDEIEALFEQADEDGDGQISLTEFRGLMVEVDFRMHDSAVDACFLKVDTDGNGRISLAELRSWWLAG